MLQVGRQAFYQALSGFLPGFLSVQAKRLGRRPGSFFRQLHVTLHFISC